MRGNREVDPVPWTHSYLRTDFVEACGDGFCWCVTSKHMTLQNPRVFVSCHISKIPVQRQFARILGKGTFSQHALQLRLLTELIASMPAVNGGCRLNTKTKTPTATDSRSRGQWLLGTCCYVTWYCPLNLALELWDRDQPRVHTEF